MLPLYKYINKPSLLFTAIVQKLWFLFPDKPYLQILFYLRMGKRLDLKNPQSFNEKLQWLKLYDRKPEYTQMVDKYAVKDYVANIIGKEYIIPTLGVWDRPEDIDFDSLPNQFVLKTTHGGGGGGVVICKNKDCFDKVAAIKKLKRSMKQNIYNKLREWPYKNVQKRVIAEKYLSNTEGELDDYKIHNFNGVPKFILLCRDRFSEKGMSDDFYSEKWEHLDVKRPGKDNPDKHEKPKTLEEMLFLAKKISEELRFSRTDFYTVNDKVYFGEITFYPASGMFKFEPEKYDILFGSWLNLF